MSDLTYLINYLAKENKTDSNGPIKKYVQFDDNFILNNFFLQAEGNQIFSAVYDTYLITVVLADNQSLWYKESSSDFVFYVKQTTNDGGTIIEEYHELNITSLHGFDFNSLDDTDSISEVYLSYNRFEYNTNTNKLYLFFEELQEVIFDGNEDNFYYTRDSLRNLKDGDYELNYKDSLGLNNDFWDNSVRKFRETNLNFKQRNLTLNFNEKNEGRVFKFPTISHQNILSRKITLDYNFDNQEPIIASKFINTNFAIRIDFNSYQAFLSFCNQVYFSNGVAFDLDISPKVEKHFYEGYHYLVTQLIQEAQRRTKSLALLLDILWYLPRTYILAEIGIGFLWDLLIAIIEEDDVNNRGLNKEDLVTYILSNLSEMLSPDNFLEVFLLKLVYNRDTTFKKLFEELNTDDFKSFINLFWRVWKQSSYASFDPKTNPAISNNEEGAPPLVLPYTSDKALGFYHSNAEIKFSNKQTSLKVALKIDTGETEIIKVSQKHYTTRKIYEHYNYNYHIFHPIAIVNDENPKFIYSKSEDQKFTVLPAFVLLANEESAFWSNLQTGGEYLLDIVTTLSGFGNLAKFRHLSNLVKLGNKLSLGNKIKKTVTGFAATIEISVGTLNALLKLTALNDTKFGRSLSEVLFFLELLSLGGELTYALRKGLRRASREVLTNQDELVKNLNKLLKEKKISKFDKLKILNEIELLSEVKTGNNLLDDFIKLRRQYFKSSASEFARLWKISVKSKHLRKQGLLKLFTKHLDEFPALARGHNQAVFNVKYIENNKIIKEINEFSLSGNKESLVRSFGNPPKLPENTLDILKNYNEFEEFVTGAFDLAGRSRKYDSEIKFVYNFLKNHVNKADEFIIETKNIFKTCGSCSKEFVLLRQLLESQGKKLIIIVHSDEAIEGFGDLVKSNSEIKEAMKQAKKNVKKNKK